MSVNGLQNYTLPLTLLGDVTVKQDLNAKDIYINGTLTGTGASTNILITNNTWTGTNTFNNVTSYTGSNPAVNDDLVTKKDVDDLATAYNPIPTDNIWNGTAIFTNANPPIVPLASVSGSKLVGYSEMVSYIQSQPLLPSGTSNTLTGNNTFTINPRFTNIPSLLIPTLDNQIASKAYVDGMIEVSGKTLTYTITVPGSYNFNFVNRSNIAKIEFILFGGSYFGTQSGSMWSGTVGNGNGSFSNVLLRIGIKDDPTNYKAVNATDVASNTYITVNRSVIGVAAGACRLANTPTPGGEILPDNSMTGTLICKGKSGAANICAYSNILGTLTSAGGAILIAYYT